MKNLLACYANCRYSGRCDDLKNEILDKKEQAAGDINAYLVERGRQPVTIQILKRGLKFTEAAPSKKADPDKAIMRVTQNRVTQNKAKRPAKIEGVLTGSGIQRRAKTKLNSKGRKKLALPPPAKSNTQVKAVRLEKARPASRLEKIRVSTAGKIVPRKTRDTAAVEKKVEKKVNEMPARALMKKRRKNSSMPKRSRSESIEALSREGTAPGAPAQASGNFDQSAIKPQRAIRRKRSAGSVKGRSASRKGSLYIIIDGKSAEIVDEQGLMQHLLTRPSATARYFEASEVEARVQIIPKK